MSLRDHLNNVGRVCEKHSPKPRPELYGNRPLASFVGHFVKLGFDTGVPPDDTPEKIKETWPAKEHMWVKVESVQGNELHGVLDNNPVYCDFAIGQGLAFTPDEIEMVLGEPEVRG